jgi:hypothetical protein
MPLSLCYHFLIFSLLCARSKETFVELEHVHLGGLHGCTRWHGVRDGCLGLTPQLALLAPSLPITPFVILRNTVFRMSGIFFCLPVKYQIRFFWHATSTLK